ncbi:MAG TPA: hypothetical protein VJV79_26685 [Polyangiaceae bacterium]|nr:hypothetical protein [Polyangiaceae bacterium]
MIGGLSSVGRLVRHALLASSCFALVVSIGARAHAQSSIRVPGQRPAYAFELEPHVLLTPFEAPDYPGSDGYGVGVRGTVELSPDGFIPKLNDSVGIGFGLDWLHYDGLAGRGYCVRFENTPQGIPVCVETSAHSSSYLFVPVVMQWNFWLHRQWSAFGEPGLALFHRSGGDFGASPVFGAGGRFHFNDSVALTLRLGYPSFSLGVSFLF